MDSLSTIQKLRKENALPYVDFALADYLLKNYALTNEVAPLLLHLSQALRAGHLCVKVDDHEVLPRPEDVWETDNTKLSPEEWREVEQLIRASVQDLPSNLITTITQDDTYPNTPLCKLGNLFYFQKYWIYESSCLQKFSDLLKMKPSLQLNPSLIQSQLSQNNLIPEQASAIAQLEKQALTVISGGPGTGKTYTAGLLIKVFWNALSKSQREKCIIALAAPTGKAAANLQKSLSKSVADLPDFPPITATTLHSLLGLKSGNQSRPSLINADLLVVDECSMIDIRLMSLLLKALKPGARLIMLGDPFQLPPIEAGSFFADMIHLCQPSQAIKLQKCLRTEQIEIVDLAKEVKNGSSQAALHLFNLSKKALHFNPLLEGQNPSQIQQQLWEKVEPYFSPCLKLDSLEDLSHFRILSPLRKGTLGVDQLNAFFYKEILKKFRDQQQIIIPIMITTNDPKRGLFNGDIGFLFKQRSDSDESLPSRDYAIFSEKKIPAILLPPYEYAYCLSVHKSQGSEFDHVLLLLPEGSEHFGRELVYTAITRARKQLEIWSTPSLFEKALSRSSPRAVSEQMKL